jgi:hypothetical protein
VRCETPSPLAGEGAKRPLRRRCRAKGGMGGAWTSVRES